MREVSERDWNGQIEIQEVIEDTQAQLKEAQITAICAMDNKVKFLPERPKTDVHNPEISQAGRLHQSCQTSWVGKVAFMQMEASALLV